jgi:hypothetical protein
VDPVKIGNFPSTTNFKNFQFDLELFLPDVFLEVDYNEEAILVAKADYDANAVVIDLYLDMSGGEVLE